MNPALHNNWHYVYLLSSKNSCKIYIGCTNDLERRLKEHERGKVCTTQKTLPLELVYYEAYKSKVHAYKREKSLKAHGSSLAKIKSRLEIDEKGRAG